MAKLVRAVLPFACARTAECWPFYACTRPQGHGGEHVAQRVSRGSGWRVFGAEMARWRS